jgi:hypothetical protein
MVSGLAAHNFSKVVVAVALALAETGAVAALTNAFIVGLSDSSEIEKITGTVLRRTSAAACSSGISQAFTTACNGMLDDVVTRQLSAFTEIVLPSYIGCVPHSKVPQQVDIMVVLNASAVSFVNSSNSRDASSTVKAFAK